MRSHLPILLMIALGGCVMEPAHADGFPPGHRLPPSVVQVEQLPPGDLLGLLAGGAVLDREQRLELREVVR